MERIFGERLADHVAQHLFTDIAAEFRRLQKFLKTADPLAHLTHFADVLIKRADYPGSLVQPFIQLPSICLERPRDVRRLPLNGRLHAFEPFHERRIVLFFTEFAQFFPDNPHKNSKTADQNEHENEKIRLHSRQPTEYHTWYTYTMWYMVAGISGLSALGWLVNSTEPTAATIGAFFIIIAAAAFFFSLAVFKIVRRAALVTFGVIIWLLLRAFGLREWYYPALLIPVLISLEAILRNG